ncbi:hypothetical protein BS78_03G154200, partial [Paspalum vaginatum]
RGDVRRGRRSAAAACDGGAAARVGVGLRSGSAVVVGGAAHGAGHVVPAQRAVADVAGLLQHPARHGVGAGAGGEAELVVLRRAQHAELPPEGRSRHLAPRRGAGQRRQRQEQEQREREREREPRHRRPL